jgi:programmed cell death 6-interacting protein
VLNVNHTRAPVSFDSFDWEIINVLLTIGLLYRSCAYGKLRVTTTETFDVNSKEIARLLCVAAGIFEHIRDEWLPRFKGVRIEEAITELTPETYTALASISLAEAQEVSVRKAMIGGMSEGALAKLCIEISRQFGAAMSCIKNVPAGENFPESFRAYMAYSQALFAAISLKHQAKEAHAKGQYGIAVGLMQKAKNRLPEEPKRWDTILTPFFEAYKMERAEILRLAQSFKTHNDRVYYDTVPDEASLPVLTEGKMLMRPIPYQLPEPLPVEINCIKDSSCVLQ